MPARVLVTGGSGFVGSAVIEELLKRGFGVNALVNRRPLTIAGDVKSFKGGLFDPAALDAACADCSQVIHLVGIIMEKPAQGVTFEKVHAQGSRNVVDAAKRNGVSRFIQMSALGTRADAVSEYHKTKWQAEQYVRSSGLQWTIFRPSMIHGPRGEFMGMEAKWARKQAAPYFFMPYFGAGLLGLGRAALVQPIYVGDVARAFVDALGNSNSIEKTYKIAGMEKMNWPQMHKTIARSILGKSRLVLPIPAWYAKLLAAVVPSSLLPFNKDQVIMSQEDNTGDMQNFVKDFGWTPRGFSETLAEYSSAL